MSASKIQSNKANEKGQFYTSKDQTVVLSECLSKSEQALKLIREVTEQTNGIVGKYEFIGGSDVRIDLDDLLEIMKSTINSRLDGRPQPFSIFDSYAYELQYSSNDVERLTIERNLRMWGEIGDLSKKHPGGAAAYIGGREFNISELEGLRNWIDSALEWHNRNL